MERRFILQGLETQSSIGVYDFERVALQRIRIDAELCLYAETEPLDDQIESTLNYDIIRETILNIVSAQHYDLQETLARKPKHGTFRTNKMSQWGIFLRATSVTVTRHPAALAKFLAAEWRELGMSQPH